MVPISYLARAMHDNVGFIEFPMDYCIYGVDFVGIN